MVAWTVLERSTIVVFDCSINVVPILVVAGMYLEAIAIIFDVTCIEICDVSEHVCKVVVLK